MAFSLLAFLFFDDLMTFPRDVKSADWIFPRIFIEVLFEKDVFWMIMRFYELLILTSKE